MGAVVALKKLPIEKRDCPGVKSAGGDVSSGSLGKFLKRMMNSCYAMLFHVFYSCNLFGSGIRKFPASHF
jgi:hypothetical protein